MKKISFGSFALTEIKKEDRRCLDRYLIKTFSDNISISDAIRNLAITKNLMYITPDALMRDWLGNKQKRTNVSDKESSSMYESALKRAFFILKEFYSRIKNAPFYKEYIYYPIYIEKVDRVTSEGSERHDAKYTNVQMNYSFIVLSNDLTKNLKIDEIRYDENASLNFLYLFVEFFSDGVMEQSIHDFDQKDYEFLVKLYQFTEKSGKEPIQMVLDLYKVIGLISKIQDNKSGASNAALMSEINKFFDTIKIDDLKRYQGLLRHKFVELLKVRKKGNAMVPLRSSFVDIMNSIFSSDGLSGLYKEVEPGATRGERYKHIYSSNKYREILNLASELVDYNKIKCNQVVTDDNLELDFKVENSSRSLDLKSGMAAQKYQTFFKDYLDSIKSYINGMVANLVKEVGAEKGVERSIESLITDAEAALGVNTPGSSTGLYNALNSVLGMPGEEQARTAVTQQENFINMLRAQKGTVSRVSAQINKDVVAEVTDHLVSAMATNLTFVYDDGKRFFSNELVAQGLVDLATEPPPNGTPMGHDLTTYDGFAKTVRDAGGSEFPPTVDGEHGVKKDNPAYFAASVTKNLGDSFEIMAKDTMLTFADHITPILQQHYYNYLEQTMLPMATPKGTPANPKVTQDIIDRDKLERQRDAISDVLTSLEAGWAQARIDNIQDTLHIDVFQNRFVDKVLRNFLRMFKTKEVKQIIEFDQNISQLHPLIKKLLKNKDKQRGGECQFFKSFIIDHEMVEQLYRLKYITDTQKFLDGLTNIAPRKLNDPMNRMQTVLYDYLGLQYNPTWVISKTNIYMSMPDDLSLTGTSILSNVPKTDLMEICRLDMKDYWDGQKMGQVAQLGNPKIKRLTAEIAKLDDEIKITQEKMKAGNEHSFVESVQQQIEDNGTNAELLEEASKRNNQKKNKNKGWGTNKNPQDANRKKNAEHIERLRKEIAKKEEQIAKEMADYKDPDFLPNATMFDDPYLSEKEPLISDKERSELTQNRDQMEEKLHELNPYDEDDVREMTANQERIEAYQEREARSHPFDFEDRETGPQRFAGESSSEGENEDWLQTGERSPHNEKQDQMSEKDRRDRAHWRR